MTESKIQKKITDHLKSKGWNVIKNQNVLAPGWPDLTGYKGGDTIFVEVKRPTGVLSKLQKYRIEKIRSWGFIVIVAYGYNDFLEKYNNL